LVVVLIVMFTGDQAGETTTTALGSSTTSTVQGTATTAEGSTTTSGETTTTAVGSTTTAAPEGLEGNWAEVPLIAAGFGALGWWDGAAWVQVEETTSLPVAGGEDYQIALLGLEARTTGSGEELLCDPLNTPGVIFASEEVLGDWPGPFGVAISANWELTPHLVEETTDDGTYAAVASQLLAERGLTVANPPIKQVIRFDLEGDGVNEVLVVAEDVSADLLAEEGDYSIAFLQKVVEGDVATAVIGESVVIELEEGETPYVLSFTVAAIADMSGDGRMEMILDSAYYEGVGVEVWEYVNDDIGPAVQIATGCGA
ncbi:MAG: hypothetical protein M3P87_05130, partial [Actinomycetota bacterium]|nr:hypothetical protein [Actinomycetota bacterium]